MTNKFHNIIRLLYSFIFILALFTVLRLVVLSYYHLRQSNGDYTVAMMLLDKVDRFNLTSYVTGVLHGWVVWIMLKIVLDK